jgi:hypothetical protein
VGLSGSAILGHDKFPVTRGWETLKQLWKVLVSN